MEESSAVKDRRIAKLEAKLNLWKRERDKARREALRANDEVGVVRDEAEELKLELL